MSFHYRTRTVVGSDLRGSIYVDTRQRIRMAATVAEDHDLSGCWNHQRRDGKYRKWGVMSGNIHYWNSKNAVAAWEFEVDATTEGDCSEPRGDYDPQRTTLILLYTWKQTDIAREVRERLSSDDGRTWGSYTVAFTGGKHPTISVGHDGTIVRAAYIDASTKIQATLQEPGRSKVDADAAPFYFKDDLGADMLFEDDCFHLVQGWRGDAPWLLVAQIAGESACSDWLSSDDGRTWKRL